MLFHLNLNVLVDSARFNGDINTYLLDLQGKLKELGLNLDMENVLSMQEWNDFANGLPNESIEGFHKGCTEFLELDEESFYHLNDEDRTSVIPMLGDNPSKVASEIGKFFIEQYYIKEVAPKYLKSALIQKMIDYVLDNVEDYI